jgi:hypothetical protein
VTAPQTLFSAVFRTRPSIHDFRCPFKASTCSLPISSGTAALNGLNHTRRPSALLCRLPQISHTEWHRGIVLGPLIDFAATLKKGAHVQIQGELRSREYEKPLEEKKKATVKQGIREIHITSILKLDRAKRVEETASETHTFHLHAWSVLEESSHG